MAGVAPRALGLALALAGLSACASPPYGDFRGSSGDCTVTDRGGWMTDRPCTAFERAWLPGARRLYAYQTVDRRSGQTETFFLEISGRHRSVIVREVRRGTFCRVIEDNPRPRALTRSCRTETGAIVPVRARG
jgi:hypothetical protein